MTKIISSIVYDDELYVFASIAYNRPLYFLYWIDQNAFRISFNLAFSIQFFFNNIMNLTTCNDQSDDNRHNYLPNVLYFVLHSDL